jgi:transposase InsO family protein
MARKVTSMRVIAAVTAFVAGEPVNVARVCREAGVSRKTFYKWAARYRQEGLAGLEERSRRPLSVPNRTPERIEEVIVGLREELAGAGLDHGATTIQWHLGQRKKRLKLVSVPSVATIHRVLVRRGLVEPQPRKRPKGSWRRFEAPAPNEFWQIDAMDAVIATGLVKVFNIIDDHSRVAVGSRAVLEATTVEAWTTFCQAGQQWGLPAGVLSDNGLCFSGKLRGFEVVFEANLREAGIRPMTGRPFHPQTTGKVERFQQTLRKWLRRQPLARTVNELQTQLDEFCRIYNHERPHQGIGRCTPISRWQATARSTPADTPLEHPTPPRPTVREAVVCHEGKVSLDKHSIHVGAPFVGATATMIVDGTYASVYVHGQLVRHLKIDRARRYQPSGRPRSGKRQPRMAS